MKKPSGKSSFFLTLLIIVGVIALLFWFVWKKFGDGPIGDAFCGAIPICQQLGLR